MPKVFIAQQGARSSYNLMFEEQGWEVVNVVKDADLIQFIGGFDVNPALYKHKKHPQTRFSEVVDTIDAQFYEMGKRHGIPMVGICRGGQFLNVCNGGTMIQHCDNHAVGQGHMLVDKETSAVVHVSSTHHQMMIPSESAVIVATANEATTKQTCIKTVQCIQDVMKEDIEVLYYEETNSLCFQPHPEFSGFGNCRHYYFSCLKRFLKIG